MKDRIFIKRIFLIIFIVIICDRIVFASQDKISRDLYDSIHQSSFDLRLIKIWIYFTDKDLNQNLSVIRNKKQINRLKKSGIIGFNNEDIPIKNENIKILSEIKVYPVTESRWLNAISAVVTAKKIYELENLEFIRKLDVVHSSNRKLDTNLSTINQHSFADQAGGLKKSPLYGNSFEQLQSINFPIANELGFSGKNVRICVLDSGYNTNHESLRYSSIVSAYDFISMDSNINQQEKDAYGSTDHGTAVLSIMSGYLPGKLIGPAYGADYILARTEEISSSNNSAEDLWVSAVEWADSLGADIVLSSTGMMLENFFNDSILIKDGVEESIAYKIVKTAASRGMLFVADAPGSYNETVMQELVKSGLDMLFVAASPPDTGGLAVPDLFDSLFKSSKSLPFAVRSSMSDLYAAEAGGNNFYGWRSGSSYIAALAAASAAILLEAHQDWNVSQILESLRRSCAENGETEYREETATGGFIDIFTAMNTVFPFVSGDFDGNGRVDGNDLAIFSSFYSKKPTDPNWNKSADLDGNLIVDGDDLAILLSHFATN